MTFKEQNIALSSAGQYLVFLNKYMYKPLLSHSSFRKIPFPHAVFFFYKREPESTSSLLSLERNIRSAGLIKILAASLLCATASCRQGMGHIRVLVS